VTVTVVGPGTPLAAHDDVVFVPAGSGPNPIDVLGNDTGAGVHVTAVTPGAHGDVAVLPFGAGVTYKPKAGFAGPDTLTYTVTDATGQTATATVTVTALAQFPPAASVTGPAAGQAGQVLAFTLGASDLTSDASAGFRYVVDWGDGNPAQAIA